jgi:acetyltransferase-like isoleucine patch superfamily enzyme
MGFKNLGENVLISTRVSLYRINLISVGDNSRIDDFCVLSGDIDIGKNVHITTHCAITSTREPIVISDYVVIALGTYIFSSVDDFSGHSLTNPTIPLEFRKVTHGKVVLEKHVIIGANSVVFPGVTISEGCAIGSMSLINKTTKPWGIYVGIPAKRIKDRKRDLLKTEKIFSSMNSKDIHPTK